MIKRVRKREMVFKNKSSVKVRSEYNKDGGSETDVSKLPESYSHRVLLSVSIDTAIIIASKNPPTIFRFATSNRTRVITITGAGWCAILSQ